MKYIEYKVHASRVGIEMVTGLFDRFGISSVSIDDPADVEDILNKKNEYDWDYFDESIKSRADREPSVSIYLEDNEENRALIQQIKIEVMKLKHLEMDGKLGDAPLGRLYGEASVVDDNDWKDKWKENFKPIKVTEKIVVKPTWEEYEAEGDSLILEIDPGMAFGTGTHETTSLCMKLMEKYMDAHQDRANMNILDVGCGSGILSIAAALLGCENVLGIEIDPDAVKVARENVQLNNVQDQVSVEEGDLMKGIGKDGEYRADIIVANLMHNLVMMLAPAAREHMAKNGVFISSGILLEKKDETAKAIREAGFEIVEISEDGEWCAIVAR